MKNKLLSLLSLVGAAVLLLILVHAPAVRADDNAFPGATDQTPMQPASPQWDCKASVTNVPVPPDVVTRRIAPAATNPAITDAPDCPHYVALSQTARRQPELFVFLPGTQLEPLQHQMLIHQAALNGYYAIGLSYHNLLSETEACSKPLNELPEDPQCPTNFRAEIITGIDTSPLVNVTITNSIVSRLSNLISYLDQQAPTEGWGQFLLADGTIAWSKIRLSGHSQGGGHTGFIATNRELARACMFAGPNDSARYGLNPPTSGISTTETLSTALGPMIYYTVPSAWITATTATPTQQLYAFAHERDSFQIKLMNWGVMGIANIAGVVNVDGNVSPYGGAHALTSSFPITRSHVKPNGEIDHAGPHGAVVKDDDVPLIAGSLPLYAPVWQYTCFADHPNPDPGPDACDDRCPDLGDAPDGNNSLGNAMSTHPFGLAAQGALYPTEFTGAAGTGPIHLNAGSNPDPQGAARTAIDSALGLAINQAGSFVSRVSNERNAFLLPDQDVRKRNIIPAPNPANGRSNRDGFDNAFVHPNGQPLKFALKSCSALEIQYAQFIHTPWAMNDFYTGTRYINVWADLNRDGDWLDANLGAGCPEQPNARIDEWLVRNLPAPDASGVFTLPAQLAPNLPDERPFWLRISVAEQPAPTAGGGVGPASGYRFGETEDHLLCLRKRAGENTGLWRPCPMIKVALHEELDDQVQVTPGELITFTATLEDLAPAFPITMTWTIYNDSNPTGNASTTVSSGSPAAEKTVITHVLTDGLADVLSWSFGEAGCGQCGHSARLAQSNQQLLNVSTTDAEGSTTSTDILVSVGSQVYLPLVTR